MRKLIITIIIALATLNCVAATEGTRQADARPAIEQTTKSQDPVVGTYKGREIHRGSKGGLWYWHTPKTGKNAGKQVKRYLNKQEREQFNAGSDGTKKQ